MAKKEVFLIASALLLLAIVKGVCGVDYSSFGYNNSNLYFSEETHHNKTLFTDKKEYFLNETVLIYLNDKNYSISINSKSSIYNLVGQQTNPIAFNPNSIGEYKIIATNKINGSNTTINFSVKEDAEQNYRNIYSDKSSYNLGEPVNIYLNFTFKESYLFYILGNEGIYQYLGSLNDTILFEPKQIGDYTIRVEDNNKILASYSFNVRQSINETEEEIKYNETSSSGNKKYKELDYIFESGTDAIIDFNFSELISSKRNLINIIFGTKPEIEKLTFYVKNHSNDFHFELAGERISEDVYKVRIKDNNNISLDVYEIIAEVTISNEVNSVSKTFFWGHKIEEEPKQESNLTENKSELINKYINYSFNISEDANIEIDFTNIIDARRDILDLGLKTTKIEELVVYVYEHEDDEKFNLTLEHVELDKFYIKIRKNENIIPDIYKLVADAKYKNSTYKIEKLFNWGLLNNEKIINRINLIVNKSNGTGTYKKEIPTRDQEEDISKDASEVSTDKKEYKLGEKVIIRTNANITRLEIIQADSVYVLEEFYANATFAPKHEGMYSIKAITNLDEILATNFTVAKKSDQVANISLPFSKKNIGIIIHNNHKKLWPSEEAVKNIIEKEGYEITLIDASCVVENSKCPIGSSYNETAENLRIIINPTLYGPARCNNLGFRLSENTRQYGTPVMYYGYAHAYGCSSVNTFYGTGSFTAQCVEDIDISDDKHNITKKQTKGIKKVQNCSQVYWIKDFIGEELSGKFNLVTNSEQTSLGIIEPDSIRIDGKRTGGKVVIFGAHDELTAEGEAIFIEAVKWLEDKRE